MASNIVNNHISSHLPVKCGVHLAERTVEVRAVGAWAQPISTSASELLENAVISAEIEEDRIKRIQQEKEAKLKKFQDEVRSRVQILQKLKTQKQLEKSYKSVEAERNIIRQSSAAAEKTTSRKNNCKLRSNSNVLSIQPLPKTNNICSVLSPHQDKAVYEEQSHQVRKFTKAARKNLVSKKVLLEKDTKADPAKSDWQHDAEQEEISLSDFDAVNLSDKSLSDKSETEIDNSPPKSRSVQFHPSQPKNASRKGARAKSARKGGNRPNSSASVPDIYPGVESEEERQQAITQRAMYRRLFMDNERQQVRENLRRRDHKQRIEVLKKEKEEERKRIEVASMRIAEPINPLSGESSKQMLERERLEQEEHQQSQLLQEKQLKRNRECERFLGALRSQLREKMAKRNIDLPALCCCGDSIWDTNPDTCANNCVYYKNPKAYAKALECVLASCDAV